MKPAPPAASKPHMLYLNRAIIPDPENPQRYDAYGRDDAPELVVYCSKRIDDNRMGWLCAFRGAVVIVPAGMIPALTISAGLRALGRLVQREDPKPHPESSRELAHRLAGIAIGALVDARHPLDVPIAFLQEESTRELVASAVAEHLSREGAAP